MNPSSFTVFGLFTIFALLVLLIDPSLTHHEDGEFCLEITKVWVSLCFAWGLFWALVLDILDRKNQPEPDSVPRLWVGPIPELDPEVLDFLVEDNFFLSGVAVPKETTREWTTAQKVEAVNWAVSTYLRNCGQEIDSPPLKPEFLP